VRARYRAVLYMMRPPRDVGGRPRNRFFAGRLGTTPEELAADPNTLVRTVHESGREVVDLLRRSASPDPAEREAARRELEALREKVLAAEGEADAASAERFRMRLNAILRDLVDRLEAAAEQARQDETRRGD
jgi:hypothetical protein